MVVIMKNFEEIKNRVIEEFPVGISKFEALPKEEFQLAIEIIYIGRIIERFACEVQYSTEYAPNLIDRLFRIIDCEDDRLNALKKYNAYIKDYAKKIKEDLENALNDIA